MKQITDDELIEELKLRFQVRQQTVFELTKLSDELKTVNRKLSESEAMKSHFLANIRNEIINPFSSIIGLSRHIINVKKEDWKKVITMASLIHSEAFELNFQLKNIFAAAEIEAGTIEAQYARVSISGIINEVIENFRPLLKNKSMTIYFDNELDNGTEYVFITDPQKLELVVSNILKNAVEFSLENSDIRIRTWINDKHELCISIKDNGIGIARGDIDKIFDRFVRVNNTINSKIKGHGLGLSVTRSLLEFMNGTIEVESESGVGSVFTVKLVKNDNVELLEGITAKSNEMFFEGGDKF